MLDKDDAGKSGFTVKDSQTLLPDERAERLAQVKSLLPPLVNGDGRLDDKTLREFLGMEGYGLAGQGYGLNFAGKGLAKIKADEPTGKEIKQEKGQSKDWDTTENVIIRGDNLDALKILRQNYTGKVKMIYIDPPYNTDRDAFLYSDSFKETESELIEKYQLDEDSINFFENLFGTKTHSGWLYFIYPRLKLARDLLTEDGAIFISINDVEQANLKLICDEVFGEENFISKMVVASSANKSGGDVKIQTNTEYCLVYSKDANEVIIHRIDPVKEDLRPLNDAPSPLTKKATTGYTVYYHPDTKDFLPVFDWNPDELETNDASKVFTDDSALIEKGYVPIRAGKRNDVIWRWRWSFDEFNNRKDEVVIEENSKGYAVKFLQGGSFNAPRNLVEFSSGTKDLKNTLGDKRIIFSDPKGIKYIKHLLSLGSGADDIVLDFFAGSGTTAESVMRQNKEDGGKRKFILVQWDEEIDKNKNPNAHDFCTENGLEPVISSICIERINRAGEKIKEEAGLEGGAMDIGYKVFSLTPRPKLETDESGQISLGNLRSSPHDTLYNMMSASGECLLSDSIEEMAQGLLYKVGDAYFLLGECTTDLKPLSGHRIYVDGYANISLEKWLNTIGLDKETVTILY